MFPIPDLPETGVPYFFVEQGGASKTAVGKVGEGAFIVGGTGNMAGNERLMKPFQSCRFMTAGEDKTILPVFVIPPDILIIFRHKPNVISQRTGTVRR